MFIESMGAKSENIARYRCFSLRMFVPRSGCKHPVIASEKTPSRISPRAAAPGSGTGGKSNLFSLEEFLQRFFIELGADHADLAGDICRAPADLCLFGNIIEMDPCSVI